MRRAPQSLLSSLLATILGAGAVSCMEPGLAPHADRAPIADLALVGDIALPGASDLARSDGPAPPDLASVDAGDAAVALPDGGGPSDMAVPDQAVPVDMTGPRDFAGARDLAVATDGPTRDLEGIDLALPCRGGYLNSTAPNACPLACGPAVTPVTDEGATHVAYGTPVVYAHDPPASGSHWPWTAPWGPHADVVPREWWVHNLEHGGIVLLYNCPQPVDSAGDLDAGTPIPNACATEIAQLTQLWAQHPQDNWWDLIFEVRILVTADPLLPHRFAAVAWDWVWMADTLDVNAVQCFIDARYGRGPEAAP